MKKYLIILFSIVCFKTYSQVGINTSTPDNSSILDVFDSNKGLLIPRVSLNSLTDNILPINAPATGLLVWNTNTTIGKGFYYFDGSQWVRFKQTNSLDGAYDEGGNGQGRIITADAGAVRIDGTDGIMITGTLASGALIDTDITGAGTRMFFNPFKAAFRAGGVSGSNFDNTNVGNYSFASGYDNRIFSGRTFGANSQNTTSNSNATSIGNGNTSFDNAAFSSGNVTTSGGNNSVATGFTTFAIGYNTFSGGEGNRANTINEYTIGVYAKTPAKTNSSGTLFVDSQSSFYTTDRALAIGNGNSSTRKNAYEVWKDGRNIINSTYTLPTADGTATYKLSTNGSGTLSWKQPTATTQITLYADDTPYTMSNTGANLDLSGFESAVIPTLFNSAGNVKVKLVIRYTNLVGTPSMRLRAHDGTTQTTPITTAGWTLTPTQTGGVFESQWRNWNTITLPNEIHLSGSMTNPGESITIDNAYLLITSQ